MRLIRSYLGAKGSSTGPTWIPLGRQIPGPSPQTQSLNWVFRPTNQCRLELCPVQVAPRRWSCEKSLPSSHVWRYYLSFQLMTIYIYFFLQIRTQSHTSYPGPSPALLNASGFFFIRLSNDRKKESLRKGISLNHSKVGVYVLYSKIKYMLVVRQNNFYMVSGWDMKNY